MDSFEIRREHSTHTVGVLDAEKNEKRVEMKFLIERNMGSVRSTVAQVLRGASASTLENVGHVESLYKMLRRHRNKIINPKPHIYEELKIGSKLALTHRNEQFYQYGIGNFRNLGEHDDFLIFYSESMIPVLKSSSVWCSDGTFSVVPKPYYQLYTISAIENVHVFPIIFCLLKNKREETYNNLFKILKSLLGDLSPSVIKTDFEAAAINAIRSSFHGVHLSTCLFHLGQALQRKLKDLNLFYLYKSNRVIKKYVKALAALIYVEEAQVPTTYAALKLNYDFPDIISPLYEYFFNNFISDITARFPLTLWNMSSETLAEIPKTNNAIEAWHMVFNSTFGTSKNNFFVLLEKLKDEEEVVKQKYLRFTFGEYPRRKRRYILMERNLREFLSITNENFGVDFVFHLVNLIFY